MAQKIIQDLSEDFLYCTICIERFQKPVMLSCLHSFCFHCLKRYESNIQGKEFPCPVCRRSVDLPEQRVEGLPHNFFLNSLMERLDLVDKLTKETSSKCNFCRGASSVLFCLDCQLHICATCKDVHSRIPGTGDHVSVSSERLSDEDYLKKMMSAQIPLCDEHQGEKLRFYCKPCSQLICRDCIVLSHQGHECSKAESEASLAKKRLENLLKTSREESEGELKFSKICDKSIKSFEKQAKELLKEVQLQYEKCVEKLKSDKDALCRKIENIKMSKLLPQEKLKLAYSDELQAMSNTQEVTSRILEENNPWEILRMEKGITRSFKELNEYRESLFPDYEYSGSSLDETDSESSSSNNNISGEMNDDMDLDGSICDDIGLESNMEEDDDMNRDGSICDEIVIESDKRAGDMTSDGITDGNVDETGSEVIKSDSNIGNEMNDDREREGRSCDDIGTESDNNDDDAESEGIDTYNCSNKDDDTEGENNNSGDDGEETFYHEISIGIRFKPSKIGRENTSEGNVLASSTSIWRNKNLLGKILSS